MSRAGWPYGKALDANGPRYFSPSALTVGDPDSNEGCLRKWFYQYVKGLKEETTKWQKDGIELHAQIENYLWTGEKKLGALALSGFHMIPTPGPDLLIEHDIGSGKLATAPLRAAGVPVVGYIDLVHARGIHKGAEDGVDVVDPGGTREVLDWKTTSDQKWIKPAPVMAKTIQMTVYGKWATTVYPETEFVRLSHGYFITKGRHAARKVSLLVHRDDIDKRWEHVERVAGSLRDVARETDADKVPGNTRACGAFRGCPHQEYCTAAQHNSLAGLVGATAAEFFSSKPSGDEMTTPNTTSSPMSLLARLQAAKAAPAAPAVPDPAQVAAEMARLAREEATAQYPTLLATVQAIEGTGLGLPTMTGELARAYKLLTNSNANGDILGTGELSAFTFGEPADLAAVLAEAQQIATARATPPAPVCEPTPTTAPAPATLLPPDAPASNPAIASASPPPATVANDASAAIAAVASDAPKPRKARTKKAPSPLDTPASEVSEVADTDGIHLYVDCVPSCPHESFWPVVNRITDLMAQRFDGADYRITSPDGPLGFGRWKGVLAAALRETEIAPGHYVLDGAMTETAQVVVEAMRGIIAQRGGMMVRGIR